MSPSLKVMEVAGSPAELGSSIGRGLAREIHDALGLHRRLQSVYLPYHRTAAGAARYETLVSIQRKRFPTHVDELHGIAEGSGRSFEELFLINMRGEYREFTEGQGESGCTTAAVVTPGSTVIAHNEDGDPVFRGRLGIVRARPSGRPGFTALTYPGFLCGNAFGFNEEGICFAVDNVRPANVRDGLGRHFIARSLFESRSLEDAVDRATPDGRASGFNYVIGSVREKRVVSVEVGPDAHRVTEVSGWFVHVNHFHEMPDAAQTVRPSSLHRLRRARELIGAGMPPGSGVWTLLCDRRDAEYPIYRTGLPPDDLATLLCAEFDLNGKTLTVYVGDPRDPDTERIGFDL